MAQSTGNRRQQPTETSQVATGTGHAKKASQSIQSPLGSNATLKAEICWTLKVVTSHYSLKSCEGINGIFNFMFPDIDIDIHPFQQSMSLFVTPPFLVIKSVKSLDF